MRMVNKNYPDWRVAIVSFLYARPAWLQGECIASMAAGNPAPRENEPATHQLTLAATDGHVYCSFCP